MVFLQGCNFDCVACHNPYTIPPRLGDHFRTERRPSCWPAHPQRGPVPERHHRLRRRGDDAARVRARLFAAVKADPTAALTCFVDSNGDADEPSWETLAPVTDGVMIDLKCLDPDIHRR